MPDGFVHLHLHSEYSLLDGGNRIDDLIRRVKELGMSAVAVTDHGNLFGAVEFYKAAKDGGVKAILGIEAYVAPDLNGQPSDRTRKETTGVADGGFHLVLLAENQTGWNNLLKLSSDSYIHGFYYKPRMDKQTLAQWRDGLIAINGHLGSSLAHHLLQFVRTGNDAHYQRALEEARWHRDTFKPNDKGQPCFFVELQHHDIQEQEDINPHLIRLARELDLPLIGDNDAHFLNAEDYDHHDTLGCISMVRTKQDAGRIKYSPQLYVKSPKQMRELFADCPEAMDHSIQIAERCAAKIDFSANHAPVVRVQLADAIGKLKGKTPAEKVRAFKSKHTPGSTEWFKDFCSGVMIHPYDATKDKDITSDQLKAQSDEALRLLSEAGAIWRYGTESLTDEYRQRLERELTVLADKSISAYFLIVWDFVSEARRRGIPANARGSGVGTMVGYVMGLSNACPVRYGLLFERFTDPDRSEYPDIDIDLCQDGRQQIIEYVRNKYGHVAQIITFNVMKARQAIRDVGRVYDLPLSEVDKVCKLIGDGLSTTIDSAMEQEPDLKALYDSSTDLRQVIDTARKLEGMARHPGVHAAGVIVATQPLDNIVPLCRASGNEAIVTQWDGPTCEKVGLLKMDFLGLRNLSIIEQARKLIEQTLDLPTQKRSILGEYGQGPRPDTPREFIGQAWKSPGKTPTPPAKLPDFDPLGLERLLYNDQNIFDLFRRGETAAIFQFESGGFRNTLLGMQPDRLEDLIAANALYRPGPMAFIPDYNDCKHGRKPVPRIHAIVDQVTAETYGIMVYQEQVMLIVHKLGDIPLRQAYTLIKAISKKNAAVINSNAEQFIKGSQQKGLTETQAKDLFEVILKFAGYGFNKSHSTGYSIIAYQTAYLKTYFPVQYMAAVLTFESVNTDKVVEYIDECKKVMLPDGRRGIPVMPPDINLSEVGFAVVYGPDEAHDPNHGHIRFGLSAVKGVGDKAIEAIIAAREKDGPFKSLYDFCDRVPMNLVNRATIEALVKCGAFDSVHSRDQRAAMVEAIEGAMQAGQRLAADREAGQLSFFEAFEQAPAAKAKGDAPKPAATLPNVEAWSGRDLLAHEKSVLGFFLSSHPLDAQGPAMQRFINASVAEVRRLPADAKVVLGGMLTRVKVTFTKRGNNPGQKMAMITFEDRTAGIDGVVFSDTFAVAAPLLQPDNLVFLRGRVDRRREEPSIRVEEVIPLERAAEVLTTTVRIHFHGDPTGQKRYNGELAQLKTLLRQSPPQHGQSGANVLFDIHDGGQVVEMRLNNVRVGVTDDLPQRIATVLRSPGCCELIGPPRILSTGNGQRNTSRLPAAGAEGETCASIDRY
ncbi:MAG: DNA polymerase III subunit alpha [Phycisphaeraceae bacterium]|nr:DNA polymerase III subunit alpha [Phycisphaeraceae bacterium]